MGYRRPCLCLKVVSFRTNVIFLLHFSRTTDATEDISQEQAVHSEASSVRGGEDELETHGGVERNEIVEETSEDLMEGLVRLDGVIEEESEAIASQELETVKHEQMIKEGELRNLRLRSDTLREKELEIESLLQESEKLKRRGEDLSKLQIEIENLRREKEELRIQERTNSELNNKVDVLAEKEREIEELRLQNEQLQRKAQEIEGKFDSAFTLRDREIERLYTRNNELYTKEKVLESLQERSNALDSQEKELEKLKAVNEEFKTKQLEMASELKEVQEKNEDLLIGVAQAEKLKEINRELCQKIDEGEILRQELGKSEAEKKELREKIIVFEREGRQAQTAGAEEVDRLRKENRAVATHCKDAEEMKKNIIKLTAQMRDMETRSQGQADKFDKKLEEFESEKKQLLERIAELEAHEENETKAENSDKEMEDLKLENIFLVERTKEINELKSALAKMAAEAKENESFKQKYKELRDVESVSNHGNSRPVAVDVRMFV